MDFFTVGILGICLLLVCLFLGLPIAVDFIMVGLLGSSLLIGLSPTLSMLGDTLYSSISNPAAVVIPLFALMGALGTEGGFAQRAYHAVHVMAARIPSSLAVATAIGSAFFGAISGSTMASAVVFGKLAYPEMKRAGYDKSFALGSIASSGTFACMIPPSGMFILFAIFTDLSVGKLFMAGIFPGLLTAVVYILSMIIRAKLNPDLAPQAAFEKKVTPAERIKAAKGLWEFLLLAGIVIGGIYSGFLTPIGAGAMGALGAFLIGFIRGPLRRFQANRSALRDTGNTAAMLFFMIIAAMFFSRFLALTQIPIELATFLQNWDIHPHFVLFFIFVLWIFLGMIMAQAAVFALTLPILFPVVVNLGYDPIWFCVVSMKLNEIASVSPPVGLSAFALAGSTEDETTVVDIYKGVWPFILCDVIVLIILFFIPSLATWLPSKL
jgi:tripartite ATP-independent transporter DctM subunit